jgi:hypothetical protein
MTNTKHRMIWAISLFTVYCCSSCCFDVARVRQVPTKLDTKLPPKQSWTLVEKADVKLESWSTTKLKAGTKWVYVGRIKEGDVYKTSDQIVTVEESNTYEAYLVLSGDSLVGFYLPVENTFSPLQHSVPLNVEKSN